MAALPQSVRWSPFLLLLAFACAAAPTPMVERAPLPDLRGRGRLYCNQVVNSSSPNRTTCVINASVTAASLSLEFPGDVSFTQGAAIAATQGDFVVQAGGSIAFGSKVTATVAGHVNLSGANISWADSSVLRAGGNLSGAGSSIALSGNASLTLKGSARLSAARVAVGDNASVNAGSILIAGNRVAVTGGASLTAVNVSVNTGPAPASKSCGHVALVASIVARDVSILTDGNVHLTGCLTGWSDSDTPSSDSDNINVKIVTLRNVTMGLQGGQWNTRRFIVVADFISMTNQTLHTGGTSCINEKSSKLDQCLQYLQYWPVDPNSTRVHAGLEDTNVTFDLQLVAHASLALHSAHLSAGSMLVCSGAVLDIETSTLDASGRGCGPGEGIGSGNVGGQACRAGGGGSHMGRGGAGANYSTTAVKQCAKPGQTYRAYDLADSWLPTKAASGGGCSVNWPCPIPQQTVAAYSSAGGLIWLSGRDISLLSGVQVIATGNQGTANEGPNASDVSGGGAGGHIFLWVYGALALDAASPALLNVNGGDIECSHRQVSGAGGGGFIGIHYTGAHVDLQALSLSYSGGGMQDQCLVWPPQAGLAATYGHAGMASSVLPCPAGQAGPLCAVCAVGTYANGTAECLVCDNKPAENSEYTAVGWPNSTCPYRCSAGIPDFRTNPECLPAPSYVFHFFGGLGGILVILICLILVSGFFLCRRRSHGKRHRGRRRRNRSDDEESFIVPCAGGCLGRACSVLRDRLLGCNFRDFPGDGEVVFTKEQLPFHLSRVYLHGENDGQFPWGLSSQLPTVIEQLVPADQWELLATELNAAAEVRSVELLYTAIMGVISPPFTASLACWFRQRRARLLQKCVHRFSEGANCAMFWKPIRARVHPAGELAMIFGCDYGATLGYIDFFDFSRSQLDWAPLDLRQDARLLVAHGKGSYADPFTLDMSDPLVMHLAQSDFGAVAVCTVISTFNRISRSIREDELACGSHSPKVLRLRQKVEQCAAQCGLAGFVQVFTCQHLPVASRGASVWRAASASVGRSEVDHSFMDLMPPRSLPTGGVEQSNPADRPAPAPAGRFGSARAPLIHPSAAMGMPAMAAPHGSPASPGSTASVSGEVESQASCRGNEAGNQQSAQAARAVEVKLCLAFIDPSALSLSNGALSPQSASAPGPPESVITSPMACAHLGEHLDPGPTGNLAVIAEAVSFARTTSCVHWWRLPVWEDYGTTTPATVLVVVIVLFFVDLLAFIIGGAMLFHINYIIFAVWILVPPFTQPLALVLGPLFLLSEMPRLGRLYASLSICGTVSAAVSTIALLAVQPVGSWFFNFAELVTVCSVKAALYFFTNVHIRNLEAAWDMSFMDAPQADFLGQILSIESGRQVSMPPYDYGGRVLGQAGFERPELGRDLLGERGQKPELQSPGKLLRSRSGSQADSFLQPAPRSLDDSPGAAKGVLSGGGGMDSFRHSSGRSWEVSSGSSPVEPSPF